MPKRKDTRYNDPARNKRGKDLIDMFSNKNGIIDYDCSYSLVMGVKSADKMTNQNPNKMYYSNVSLYQNKR